MTIEKRITSMIAKAICEGLYNQKEPVIFDYTPYLTDAVKKEAQDMLDNDQYIDENTKISKELSFVIFGLLIKYGYEELSDPYQENIDEDNICIAVYYNNKKTTDDKLSDIEETVLTLIKEHALGIWIAAEYEYIEGSIEPYDPGDYWTPPSGGGIDGSDLDIDDIEILGIGEDLAYINLLNYPEIEKVAQQYYSNSKVVNKEASNILQRLDDEYYEQHEYDDGWCEDE